MRKQSFSEQGQSLVEIALILPVLLILFLGVAEVGFFFYAHVQVANAAREGARYGSLCRLNANCNPDLTAEVTESVFNETQTIDLNAGNTTVDVQPSGSGGWPGGNTIPMTGTPITVTVTYNHSPPFVSSVVPMFPSELPIQYMVVMLFDK